MFGFGSVVKRLALVGSLVVAATLVVGQAGALAQSASPTGDCSAIQFEMSNPSPGSRVDPGNYVLQGIAFDSRAEGGPGIDRVDFFLGNRETGGVIVGHAVPSNAGPFDTSSFQTTITLPNVVGGQELFGYAHSAITGDESIISVPIALGVDPSKAGALMAEPEVTTCAPTTDMATAQPAMEEQPAPETPVVSETPAETPPEAVPAPADQAPSQMFLDVGNPSAGDTVHVGGYMIEGIAFDRAADQGPGIDHIDVFLDDRDGGGTLIGHAVLGASTPAADDPALAGSGWTAEITLSNKMTGPHTMFFYALSGVTGEEMVVGVPIRIVP
jgi:hypothetical protein